MARPTHSAEAEVSGDAINADSLSELAGAFWASLSNSRPWVSLHTSFPDT